MEDKTGNVAYVKVCLDPESVENVKKQIDELEKTLEKANALLKALTSAGEISLPIRFSSGSENLSA